MVKEIIAGEVTDLSKLRKTIAALREMGFTVLDADVVKTADEVVAAIERIGAAREEHHLRIHVRLRIIACGRERNKAFAFVVKLRHYGKRAVKLVLGLCEKAARGLLLNHQHHARYPFGIAKEHKHYGRCYIIGQVAHRGKFAFRAAYVELQYVAVYKR